MGLRPDPPSGLVLIVGVIVRAAEHLLGQRGRAGAVLDVMAAAMIGPHGVHLCTPADAYGFVAGVSIDRRTRRSTKMLTKLRIRAAAKPL